MEDLKPSSREEAVLAKIAGIEDPMVDAFEPSSREEWFMNQIAERMGEGGGGSGGAVMVVVHAADTEIDGVPAKILDKTAGEIIAAAKTGYVVLDMYNGIEEGSRVMPLTAVYFDTIDEALNITFGASGKGSSFTGKASTENDYPVVKGMKVI